MLGTAASFDAVATRSAVRSGSSVCGAASSVASVVSTVSVLHG
jgi:hypothetical protein